MLLPAALAVAATPAVKVDVLRARAIGDVLDVLLRVDVPGDDEGLGPGDFAVYIAPATLPVDQATAPKYKVARVFLKRLRGAYFLDLRQLPPDVRDTACQLVLRLRRRGVPVTLKHIPRLLDAPDRKLDVALLIDESLSMRRTDPKRLRIEAARTFIDLARRSTRIAHIGIVAFNDRARRLAPLTSLDRHGELTKAIQAVRARGQTDMDGALALARSLFATSTGDTAKAVVLLTDGKDEPGRYENAHALFARNRWRVYTVGLSGRADAEVLRRIARDTGGEYHEAPTSAELQDIFGKICLALQEQLLIRSRSHHLPAATVVAAPFPVDDTISALTVSLQAPRPDVAFALADPAGSVRTHDAPKSEPGATARKGGYQYFNVWRPWFGQWTARLAAAEPTRVALSLRAATPLLVRAFPLKTSYYRGEPVELAVSLANVDAPLAKARVQAHLTAPDGTTATVTLHDDGRHQDTGPDDGVFAGVFPGTSRPGPLAVRFVATGTTPAARPFERELTVTTTVSPEGHSQLWAAAPALDFGTLFSGETARRSVDLKLTSTLPRQPAETVQAKLEPPKADSDALPADALRLAPVPLRLEPGRLTPLALTLTVPAAQPAGRYRGRLRLTSRYDERTLAITVEIRHPKLVLSADRLELGPVESGQKAQAALTLRLEPRGRLPVRLHTRAKHVGLSAERLDLGPKPVALRLAFAPPAAQPTASIEAKLVVESPLGRSELPLVARVVRPSLAISPEAIDFGELAPDQTRERKLVLELQALEARRAAISLPPLAAEGDARPIPAVVPVPKPTLKPGEKTIAALRLHVPPTQPPGTYRGHALVDTPLGKRRVPCTVRVAAVPTFRVVSPLDFGRVALGAEAERAVEIESLANGQQAVSVTVPPAAPGWRLTVEPGQVTIPAKGKATVRFRLAASAAAAPGPRQATVALGGPSQGATLDVRATLFRPPHQSLAFDPPLLDVGDIQAGLPARRLALVQSLVDEDQPFAVERIEAPPDLLRIEAEPVEATLGGGAARPLVLRFYPAHGLDGVPFEAFVHVRGRSEPASLRIRGRVVTPPGVTLGVEPRRLEFGRVPRGESRALPLAVQSLYHYEQQVALAAPPVGYGVALTGDAPFLLPPGAAHQFDIHVAVGTDAPLGVQRFDCVLEGAGEPATFEAVVQVVPPPPPLVAVTGDEGIGWGEGLVIFLLIALLIAALILAYLLARWLLRTNRLPRMAKYFALSVLVHAVVLFAAIDLFVARQVQKHKVRQGFKVGLKAMREAIFSARKPSVADRLTARRERESKVAASRRRTAASELARRLAEARRRKLTAAKAKLARPKSQERIRLSKPAPPRPKLTVEDLTQLLEEIRETEKARQQPKTDRPDAARTDAARIAQLRQMTRQQLEAVVRETLRPKPSKPARPKRAAAQPSPDVARPKLAEKAVPTFDELRPSLEGLKQELQQAVAKAKGALGSQRVASARPSRRPAVERGPAPGSPSRPARRGPSSPPATAAAERPSRAAAQALPAIGDAPGGSPQAGPKPMPFSFDAPVEQATTAGPGGPPATAPRSPVRIEAAGVGTARASAKPTASGGARRAPAAVRPGALPQAADAAAGEPGQRAASGPPIGDLGGPGGPMARPQTSPPSFGSPDEAPIVSDPLVNLARGPASGTPAAAPIAVSRRGGSSAAPERRAWSPGPPMALAPGGPAAQPAGTGRPKATAPLDMPQSVGEPSSPDRHAPAPSFDAPSETPAAGELVARAVDGMPRGAAPEARAVGAARPAAGPSGRAPRHTAAAPRSSALEPGATPGPTAADRRPAAPPALPSRAPAAGPAAKAAPDFDEPGDEGLELVESPLVAPRESAEGPADTLAPRTVVARWRLRRRSDGGQGREALASAAPAIGQLIPRSAPHTRAAAVDGSLAQTTRPTAQGRRQTPDWSALPGEAVREAAPAAPEPREGAAAGGEWVAARSFDATHAGRRTSPGRERAAPDASDPASRALAPRETAPGPRPSGADAPFDTADRAVAPPAQGSSAAPDLADDAPGEAIDEGPRVAERPEHPDDGGITPRTVEPAARRRAHRLPTDPGLGPRLTAPRRRTVAPRAAPRRQTAGRDLARLLLPGVGRRGLGAGLPVGTERGGSTVIPLITLKYGSGRADWDNHKTALHFLAWQLRERIGFQIETRIKVLSLGDADQIAKAPLLYMSGHNDFRLPRRQLDNLRRYLLAGGTLWAEDSTHEDDETWDRAFRREIARVLPPDQGYRLRKITKADNHPLFRACYDLREGYQGYFPPPGDKFRQNFVEGIDIGGRLAVVYTRNDYGDGLEIRVDTHPLKASLSGLSPAQMQEASVMMAANILFHTLAGGRAAGGRFLAMAADSLRHHQAAERVKADEYADARVTPFENFAEERWTATQEWDKAGSATIAYARHPDPAARGRRLTVRYRLARGQAKIVLLREIPEEADLTNQDRIYIDIESRLAGGARFSIALITLPGWKYYESVPAFLKPGRNRVHFDLRAATWKTGEPVPEGQTEYCRRPTQLDGVRRIVLLLYPIQSGGTLVVDNIEFRTKR